MINVKDANNNARHALRGITVIVVRKGTLSVEQIVWLIVLTAKEMKMRLVMMEMILMEMDALPLAKSKLDLCVLQRPESRLTPATVILKSLVPDGLTVGKQFLSNSQVMCNSETLSQMTQLISATNSSMLPTSQLLLTGLKLSVT